MSNWRTVHQLSWSREMTGESKSYGLGFNIRRSHLATVVTQSRSTELKSYRLSRTSVGVRWVYFPVCKVLAAVGLVAASGACAASQESGVTAPSRSPATSASTSTIVPSEPSTTDQVAGNVLIDRGPPGFTEAVLVDHVGTASDLASAANDPTEETTQLNRDSFQTAIENAWLDPTTGQRATVEALEFGTANQAQAFAMYADQGYGGQTGVARLQIRLAAPGADAWEWSEAASPGQFEVALWTVGVWLFIAGTMTQGYQAIQDPLQSKSLSELANAEYEVASRV